VAPATVRTSRAGTWISPRAPRSFSGRAFTLVELVVVLIVVGISASLVFPKVSGLLLRAPEPWRSGRQLLRLAKYARELAIATESTFVLSLDPNTGDYWVAGKEGDRQSGAVVAVPSDLKGHLSEEVRVADVELAGDDWDPRHPVTMEFGPEGSCDAVAVSLTSSEGRTVRVVVGEWSEEIDPPNDDG
jgi:prepilin-type N-terminal cleavage/methylation domain-containing protein